MPSASQLPRNPSRRHFPDMSRDILGLQRAGKSRNFITLEDNQKIARNSPTVISCPTKSHPYGGKSRGAPSAGTWFDSSSLQHWVRKKFWKRQSVVGSRIAARGSM